MTYVQNLLKRPGIYVALMKVTPSLIGLQDEIDLYVASTWSDANMGTADSIRNGQRCA